MVITPYTPYNTIWYIYGIHLTTAVLPGYEVPVLMPSGPNIFEISRRRAELHATARLHADSPIGAAFELGSDCSASS